MPSHEVMLKRLQRLTPDQLHNLERLSKLRHVPISELVRQAVDRFTHVELALEESRRRTT